MFIQSLPNASIGGLFKHLRAHWGAAGTALAAVALLGIAVPKAQAEIVSGYIDGVTFSTAFMRWSPSIDEAFVVPAATGRLSFSYDTKDVTLFSGGVARLLLSGELTYASSAFTATTTITQPSESGSRISVLDNGGGKPSFAPDDYFKVTVGDRFGLAQEQWRITIPGVPTVDSPDTRILMEFVVAFPATTFDGMRLFSGTSIGPGGSSFDATQHQGLFGVALRDGVPTRYFTDNSALANLARGQPLVITSSGGGNVPEPSVFALLAIAAAGASLASRRRPAGT